MFVAHGKPARLTLAVVALGKPERLAPALAALAAHQSRHAFDIVCVLNPDSREPVDPAGLPHGVLAVTPDVNVGWAGGLHLARAQSKAEFLAWVQDDMALCDGWLDAMVDAADAHPEFGAYGEPSIEPGVAHPGGGYADGPVLPDWAHHHADTSGDGPPVRVDWLLSRGLVTRTAAWDACGGAEIRLFPLHLVDLDYCSHLRVHGWPIAVVRGAAVTHQKGLSSPHEFRRALRVWQQAFTTVRWGTLSKQLAREEAREVPHDCAPWIGAAHVPVEQVVGRAAAQMLIPVVRGTEEQFRARIAKAENEVAYMRKSLSWKLTAPLRALRGKRR